MNNLIENQEDDKENVKIENFYSIGGINNNEPSSKQKFFQNLLELLFWSSLHVAQLYILI